MTRAEARKELLHLIEIHTSPRWPLRWGQDQKLTALSKAIDALADDEDDVVASKPRQWGLSYEHVNSELAEVRAQLDAAMAQLKEARAHRDSLVRRFNSIRELALTAVSLWWRTADYDEFSAAMRKLADAAESGGRPQP